MTNIVKKMKNVNMFTKLVGLVAVFSVVSCDCKKGENAKEALKLTITDPAKGEMKFKGKIQADGADVKDLDKITVKFDVVEVYKKEDYTDPAGADAKKAVKLKENGKSLKVLAENKDEIKKDDTKEINFELEGIAADVKSLKANISLIKGSDVIVKDKEVKWVR